MEMHWVKRCCIRLLLKNADEAYKAGDGKAAQGYLERAGKIMQDYEDELEYERKCRFLMAQANGVVLQ